MIVETGCAPDLRDVKGQESAKRALEIAAAGGHNLLMSKPINYGSLPRFASSPNLEVAPAVR